MLAATGTWRVYFNRHQAAPLVWCVAPEDMAWEMAVERVDLVNVSGLTLYTPSDVDDDESGVASAFIVVFGHLTVDARGVAVISGGAQ